MKKPHAVMIPFPAQAHISAMFELAKLIHHRGFHVTFINTEYNHRRLIQSGSNDRLRVIEDFKFEMIPDGLPLATPDRTQDIPMLCSSIRKNFWAPFRSLVIKLNESPENPPVTCIVADGVMSFTLRAADELGIPVVFFRTHSACGFWGYAQIKDFLERGYIPLQDEKQLKNGHLETRIDWITGMLPDLRLKDLPSVFRIFNRDNIRLNYADEEAQAMFKGTALIINTFAELEPEVLQAARSRVLNLFAVGPIRKLSRSIACRTEMGYTKSSLWKEDESCLPWLEKHKAESVVYVNFGSITVMTPQQLEEFAWGLANSRHPLLWIIRPDLVKGHELGPLLSKEFGKEIEGRGLLASWCAQEEVLSHPSVGLFLTHCGWNSTLESICGGVPMLCWPFFAEQPTNCRYVCTKWGMGMEIEGEVKRGEVERLVREAMEGEKGREMRERVRMWKQQAELAVQPGGSSYHDFHRLVDEVLLKNWRK
ncbi:7-deoxyloganetin glucosyltransferase-like [Nymphaea colorata]|nr:7-deoxyloganetin glucosyltransferase-like [Nymphaea colorata]